MVKMEFDHVPVLLNETVDNLVWKKDGIYVDGTLGGGGHSKEVLKRIGSEGRLIGIDRDSDAIEAAQNKLSQYKEKLMLAHSNFSDVKNVISKFGLEKVDGMMMDLGVSSPQLDNPERGFSYMNDAPLDMRMDKDSQLTAEYIVNNYTEEEIKSIIKDYGEERWASRIAGFIVNARERKHIKSTFELVEIIKEAIPAGARREGPHPAKRTFQALRIAVNRELDEIEHSIPEIIDILNPGGRLCIITFHSLEDRIVKDSFKKLANPCTCPADFPVCVCGKKPQVKIITRKPIIPDKDEIDNNPRSRSAKLRVAEKL